MEIEHVLFSSNTQQMSETCQKLAFTHPIVVLKSGLKNNWMKKLDRVNRPSNANSHLTIFDIPMRPVREDQRHRQSFTG